MKFKILLFILLALPVQAAFELSGSNAFSNALGRSGVTNQNSFAAFLLNPALSAAVSGPGIGISYLKPYNLAGLSAANLIATVPFQNFGLSGTVYTFGNLEYQEIRVSTNISHRFLQNRLFLGLNLHWHQINFAHYGSTGATIGLDLGAFVRISRFVSTGFSLLNVNQPAVNGHREEMPVVTTWGIAVQPGDQIVAYLTVEKDRWYPVNISLGVEAPITRYLLLQSGFQTNPTLPSLGFQFRKGWFALFYAFQYHFQLGPTHAWGLMVTRGK